MARSNLNLPLALVRTGSIELNRIAAPVQLFFINPIFLTHVRIILLNKEFSNSKMQIILNFD